MRRSYTSTQSSKRAKSTRSGILSQGLQLFSKQEKTLKTLSLRSGFKLVDTEQKTMLVDGDTILQEWDTARWVLLGVDRQERIAYFEADDSWMLAQLQLDTGTFKADDDPLFIQYSLNEDEDGTYVFDEIAERKNYLK